ncbi:hypothetical protein ASG43_14140 [Aureimonas sp. Leaf454]|uniref:hypothetical protein n=1 Tax=Aureimonas sp. Leaf454 TaxID=1736381 RepID=UPI000714176D|nr:hypothetical protein [Aureimonas sp. Leaf454]KQT44478.1 hypothetical protein ASG43_14140 [Aureimonas sp. Leaf454]
MSDNPDWRVHLGRHWAEQFQGSPFSFAVGDGWADLLRTVFRRVDAVLDDDERGFFAWSDIKEKFGAVRMTHNGSDHVDAIVDWAEEASKRICDRCGREGRMHTDGGWCRVRCDVCVGL